MGKPAIPPYTPKLLLQERSDGEQMSDSDDEATQKDDGGETVPTNEVEEEGEGEPSESHLRLLGHWLDLSMMTDVDKEAMRVRRCETHEILIAATTGLHKAVASTVTADAGIIVDGRYIDTEKTAVEEAPRPSLAIACGFARYVVGKTGMRVLDINVSSPKDVYDAAALWRTTILLNIPTLSHAFPVSFQKPISDRMAQRTVFVERSKTRLDGIITDREHEAEFVMGAMFQAMHGMLAAMEYACIRGRLADGNALMVTPSSRGASETAWLYQIPGETEGVWYSLPPAYHRGLVLRIASLDGTAFVDDGRVDVDADHHRDAQTYGSDATLRSVVSPGCVTSVDGRRGAGDPMASLWLDLVGNLTTATVEKIAESRRYEWLVDAARIGLHAEPVNRALLAVDGRAFRSLALRCIAAATAQETVEIDGDPAVFAYALLECLWVAVGLMEDPIHGLFGLRVATEELRNEPGALLQSRPWTKWFGLVVVTLIHEWIFHESIGGPTVHEPKEIRTRLTSMAFVRQLHLTSMDDPRSWEIESSVMSLCPQRFPDRGQVPEGRMMARCRVCKRLCKYALDKTVFARWKTEDGSQESARQGDEVNVVCSAVCAAVISFDTGWTTWSDIVIAHVSEEEAENEDTGPEPHQVNPSNIPTQPSATTAGGKKETGGESDVASTGTPTVRSAVREFMTLGHTAAFEKAKGSINKTVIAEISQAYRQRVLERRRR